ncbi:MAG: hypothetical protein IKL82_03215 [Clostridia bacterium]|nr:hypothetical protein [Clostridia bacterium]
MTQKTNESVFEVKFGLKSFLTVCSILLGVMIFVGILTFVIPAGEYLKDGNGNVIVDSYHQIESTTRLPVWRWFTAPIEALVIGEGNFNVIQIILVLLVLGGTFKVLDKTGSLYALVQLIIYKFYNRRYLLIWIVTLFMMLLASCFGLQEELLILFPIFLAFAKAMKWSKVQAISLILITTGVGFTTATFNPFTIGVAAELAGVSILNGLWYRAIIFAVLYVLTSLYLVLMAKKDEKLNLYADETVSLQDFSSEQLKDFSLKSRRMVILFLTVLAVIVLSSIIPFIADLGIGMVLMALTFVVGSMIIGVKALGSIKSALLAFLEGVKDIAPSIVIILLAFSVKYIADNGNILHTIFYYCHAYIISQSPYVAIILIYLLILVFEFFIPGSLAKALLLIPLLTIAPIPNISVNVILLAFLFGDGYTNVLYPTCGTLVVGLSLAEVNYATWIKKTALFQLALFALSILFLVFAVYIGL